MAKKKKKLGGGGSFATVMEAADAGAEMPVPPDSKKVRKKYGKKKSAPWAKGQKK